jgi:hypothetical protein
VKRCFTDALCSNKNGSNRNTVKYNMLYLKVMVTYQKHVLWEVKSASIKALPEDGLLRPKDVM